MSNQIIEEWRREWLDNLGPGDRVTQVVIPDDPKEECLTYEENIIERSGDADLIVDNRSFFREDGSCADKSRYILPAAGSFNEKKEDDLRRIEENLSDYPLDYNQAILNTLGGLPPSEEEKDKIKSLEEVNWRSLPETAIEKAHKVLEKEGVL